MLIYSIHICRYLTQYAILFGGQLLFRQSKMREILPFFLIDVVNFGSLWKKFKDMLVDIKTFCTSKICPQLWITINLKKEKTGVFHQMYWKNIGYPCKCMCKLRHCTFQGCWMCNAPLALFHTNQTCLGVLTINILHQS